MTSAPNKTIYQVRFKHKLLVHKTSLTPCPNCAATMLIKIKCSALAAVIALQGAAAFAPSALSPRLPHTSLDSGLKTLAGKLKNASKSKGGATTKKVDNPDMAPAGAINEKQVRALFELWNTALATGDSRIVADRYIKKPVLLPTVSDKPRTDYDSVKDYFDAFLEKKPQGKLLSVNMSYMLYCHIVHDISCFLNLYMTGKILKGDIHIGDGWASVRLCNNYHLLPSENDWNFFDLNLLSFLSRMLASMSSPWVRPATRSKHATPTTMCRRTGSGRFSIITPR